MEYSSQEADSSILFYRTWIGFLESCLEGCGQISGWQTTFICETAISIISTIRLSHGVSTCVISREEIVNYEVGIGGTTI
jgi:hypothetical protein